MAWTDEEVKKMHQLREEGKKVEEIANELDKTYWAVQKKIVKPLEERVEAPLNYKSSLEIMSDGSHKSDKLLQMDAEKSKDVDYLLIAHGYDVDKWELVSARNNIWNTNDKENGVQTLYSSKITVKPKRNNFSIDKLIESIKKTPQIIFPIEHIEQEKKKLLEIPLFDQHFGISDYEYYQPTQRKIMHLISSEWEEVLFIIGQDTLHTDNFRGQTANGTIIEQIDFVKAWEDARRFYEPLLERAIRHSNRVKVMYSKGNHDESMSWAFVQLLKAKYPQIQFDDTFTERKAHVFHQVFIGVTHGDKARKNLHNIFPVEFPNEWSKAKIRELHCGHLHVEDGKDIFGMMVRTLATRNKTDKWHKDMGFVGAHKRFMLFEYSEDALESIHYV